MRIAILLLCLTSLAGCATMPANSYEAQKRREQLERAASQPSLYSPRIR